MRKELAESFYLTAEYQLRTEHSFQKIDRHQFSFDLSYDFNKWLSAGLTYTLIERYGQEIGFAEFRLILNNPDFSAKYDAASKTYTDYHFLGYRFAYFNRYRGALGLLWNITPQHSLDFYCFVDYHYNRVIDTNKAGNLLEGVTWEQILITTAGVRYTFSF